MEIEMRLFSWSLRITLAASLAVAVLATAGSSLARGWQESGQKWCNNTASVSLMTSSFYEDQFILATQARL